MVLPRWLRDRLMPARFRQEVAGKATDLLSVHGGLAYRVAREQARMERAGGRLTECRFWSRVAVDIARREGRADQIGVKGGDRWPDP
jgi:hypothetical protein